MSAVNFGKCLAHTLVHEGKFSDHPRDPGGRTAYGITQRVYDAYRKKRGLPTRDVFKIEPAERRAIYFDGYWEPVQGDALPEGLDYIAFDAAVNSGVSRGVKWLQQGLGIKADGKAGPATVEAARAAPDRRAVVRRACAARMGFLRSLGTFSTFGRGWSRRVADVEAKASAMASANPADARAYALAEASRAGKAAKAQSSAGATSGASGVGSTAATVDPSSLDQIAPWIGIGVAAVLIIVAVVLLARANRNRDRAKAFAASAEGMAMERVAA